MNTINKLYKSFTGILWISAVLQNYQTAFLCKFKDIIIKKDKSFFEVLNEFWILKKCTRYKRARARDAEFHCLGIYRGGCLLLIILADGFKIFRLRVGFYQVFDVS